MIRPGLRIVFDREDRGVFPIHARRNRFDQPPDGVVVVRNHELRRRKPFFDSRGVIVGKAHHHERRHGIRFACLALGDESLKLREPFAKPRVPPAAGMGMVFGHRGVRASRRFERGFVAIHGHDVRRREVEAAEARAVMIRERSLVGNVANGFRNIRISLVAPLLCCRHVIRGNHRDEFPVIPVTQSCACGGVPQVKRFRLAEVREPLPIGQMLF